MRLLLILLVIPFLANGQYAVIKGVAPLGIGQQIQLRINDDPISGKERVIASQEVDVDGSFDFKVIPNGAVQYVFLQLGQNCSDFFIERDKDLELTFVAPREDPLKPKAFNERQFFTPKFTGGKSAKLNQQIVDFNKQIDTFLEGIYPMLKQRKSPGVVGKEVAKFQKKMATDFKDSEPFVQDYTKYSIAGVEQTFLTDKERLYEKYLKGVKPDFSNPAYTDFVLQFYEGEVYKMAMVTHPEECRKILKGNEAFAKMDEMLRESVPEITDVSVRRLVLIQGIDRLFGQKDFEGGDLIRALRSFAGLSSNSTLGTAAQNIAFKHEVLTNGSMAPEIVYTDLDGFQNRLSDSRGEYVFLELTDAKNVYSNRETNVISSLKEEFKFVKFVTVCVGNTEKEVLSLKKKMNIDWKLGRVDMFSSAVEDYRIKSLPMFFIIAPDGKFYAAPAKDPTTGAQGELMSLTEKLKAQGRKGVGK